MNYDAKVKQTGRKLNHEGGEAYTLDAETELYTAVVTSSLSPLCYECEDERIDRICRLVADCDDSFVAQLAVYARQQMNLRSVPLLLVVELARKHHGDDLVARAVEGVVQRADEIMELLTCYQWRNPSEGRKKLGRLSRQIQNGLQHVFNRFDEYQFAKYNQNNREVRLRDALFLVHPKARDEAQHQLFDKIAADSLETPYTWEVELSAVGQEHYNTPEEKQTAVSSKWQELIKSGKLGYMALLRNLRNILSCKGMPVEVMGMVGDRLTDESGVERSKQLPFRFLAAYREVKAVKSFWTQHVLDALEIALGYSAGNIAGFAPDCRVVVAADVSASMYSPVSPRSSVRLYDIGLLLAMMLKSRCRQVVSGMFGTTWKTLNLPSSGMLANVDELYRREGEVGYATNGHEVVNDLIRNHLAVDKVMLFTDCQLWNNTGDDDSLSKAWNKYKEIAPEARLYLFDLAGYGQSPLSMARSDVYLIAGWSDKIFDVLQAVENQHSALDEIKKIKLLSPLAKRT